MLDAGAPPDDDAAGPAPAPPAAGDAARIAAHRAVCAAAAEALRPEPVLTLPAWCAANIDMPLSSPLPGPMDASAVPAALPIYECWTDPAVREIIIRGPTQTLKSQLMICALLYEAATFPGPFAVYQPDKALARRFSQTRIPEVAAHTRLAPFFQRTARGSGDKGADGGTIAERHFPGGTCKIVGVGDRSALVSDPIRIAFIDEINLMAGVDVVGMTNDRLSTFPDRRRFIASSPGDHGVCAITAEWQRGDQREWHAVCPHAECGEAQPLDWRRVQFHPRDPDSARYECAGCGALWDDDDLLRANRAGHYVAAADFHGVASFALNALANPMLSLSHLAREWIDAYEHMESTGDLLKLKTFTRSRMALPWKDDNRRLDATEIQRTCAIKYPANCAPPGVLAAVLAVDTQDDRLEAEVVGWGLAPVEHDDLKMRRALRDAPPDASTTTRWTLRRYGLGYHVFVGDPSAPAIWNQLNALYDTPIPLTPDGRVAIKPSVMFVDSGGHYTDRVRDFVAGRGVGRENVFPIKGANTNDAPLVRASRSRDMLERYQNSLIFIGTFGAKEIVYRHLAASRHMPARTKLYNYPRGGLLGYTDKYFDGLTSEEKVNRRDRNGQVRAAWVCADGRANEPLDLATYSYAAIRHLGGVDYLHRREKIIRERIAAAR